jgi:sugar phosphate isomerase/epimerase
MKHMKSILQIAVASFVFMQFNAQAESLKNSQIGLQLYSLRNQFQTNVPATLNLVKNFGVCSVELAGTYNRSPEEFRTDLAARGLNAISGHFAFERFRDDPEGVVREAKILGLKYAGCAWIPHTGVFDEKSARVAAAVFNHAGQVLAKNGLKFFYHTHGYEFQPFQDGTLFDVFVRDTNPKFVNFEMDVFWVVQPGQNPVKLLETYGSRWCLMHVKGMRDNTPTGLLTGSSDVTNDVAVGTGKINYLPILDAGKKAGVKFFFIEDESPSSVQQIPQSLDFLHAAKW